MKIGIIGSGVIGSTIALELSKDHDITILDKNKNITGLNQSTRNSGVIHAGVYYDKEIMPLRAKLCVEGRKLLYKFSEKHKVLHKKLGKLIVANDNDQDMFQDTLRISKENKVQVKELDENELNSIEPNVKGISALFFPDSGIINPLNLLKKVHKICTEYGVNFHFNSKVNKIKKSTTFQIGKQNFEFLINAAGVDAPRIAHLINSNNKYEQLKIIGSTFYFDDPNMTINHIIYPVPHFFDKKGKIVELSPSKANALLKQGKIQKTTGAHLTPTLEESGVISSKITIGPLYNNISPEIVRSYFPKLPKYYPYLTSEYAKIKGERDFIIKEEKKAIHLLNIDSPGLTSSLAIAKHVNKILS